MTVGRVWAGEVAVREAGRDILCCCFGDCGRDTGFDRVGLAICLKGDFAGLVGEVLTGLRGALAAARVIGDRGLFDR